MKKSLIILVVVSTLLTTMYKESFGQKIEYKGFIESGVFLTFKDSLNPLFSGYVSNGISIRNLYVGLGFGYDRYDSLALIPLFFDLKYSFIGHEFRKSGRRKYEPGSYRNFNAFFFANIGRSNIAFRKVEHKTSDLEAKLLINTGIGFVFGAANDVNFLLTFGFKSQEFFDSTQFLDPVQSLTVRLGASFTP